jgi:hypothetical protein
MFEGEGHGVANGLFIHSQNDKYSPDFRVSLAKTSSARKRWASNTFPGILCRMIHWLIVLIRLVLTGLKSRRNLLLENLALRHQLLVLRRSSNRPRLTPIDRVLWAWLTQVWDGWKICLSLAQPSTVIRWHRAGFGLFW